MGEPKMWTDASSLPNGTLVALDAGPIAILAHGKRIATLVPHDDCTPTRAELLALVERMDARAKEMQRDTITQGHELGRFARELAALLGGDS